MESELFNFAAEVLEQRTSLDRLQARGTLRIALRGAGVKAKSVTVEQLRVVFEQLMPAELDRRGIPSGADTCRAVIADLEASPLAAASGPSAADPDAIFRRLGGD